MAKKKTKKKSARAKVKTTRRAPRRAARRKNPARQLDLFPKKARTGRAKALKLRAHVRAKHLKPKARESAIGSYFERLSKTSAKNRKPASFGREEMLAPLRKRAKRSAAALRAAAARKAGGSMATKKKKGSRKRTRRGHYKAGRTKVVRTRAKRLLILRNPGIPAAVVNGVKSVALGAAAVGVGIAAQRAATYFNSKNARLAAMAAVGVVGAAVLGTMSPAAGMFAAASAAAPAIGLALTPGSQALPVVAGVFGPGGQRIAGVIGPGTGRPAPSISGVSGPFRAQTTVQQIARITSLVGRRA